MGTSLLTTWRGILQLLYSSLGSESWPPSSESSSVSYSVIWALGFSLGILTAASLRQVKGQTKTRGAHCFPG